MRRGMRVPDPERRVKERGIASCLLAFLAPTMVDAQPSRSPGIDTLYVKDYSHLIAGRAFASTKFNTLSLRSQEGQAALIYRPNNQVNLGIGVSYRKLTLNIGIKAPWLNRDDRVYGKTRYIDAQANMLSPERATNLFLQYFRGYHISSHSQAEVGWQQQTSRPYRSDLEQINIGISTLKMTNARRFSYRAAFNQDAWQRLSQGSWMYGGYATWYHVRADSSLIPERIAARYQPGARIRIGDFGDLGLMGGYAYTYVLGGHWFLTGSAALGLGASIQRVVRNGDADNVATTSIGPDWHGQLRGGFGYNSSRDEVALIYNQERTAYFLTDQNVLAWSVGNVRLIYVHRFSERVPFIDKVVRFLKRKHPAEGVVPAADGTVPP